MYELIKEGKGKGKALIEAQRWLKDPGKREEIEKMLREKIKVIPGRLGVTREWRAQMDFDMELPRDVTHPYYWAGFICCGAP